MYDIEEGIMESKRHFSILHTYITCISFQFINYSPYRLKFLLGIGPKDKSFLQQKQTSLHNLFVIFVTAIIKRHFNKKVKTNLSSSIVQSILQNSTFLMRGSL